MSSYLRKLVFQRNSINTIGLCANRFNSVQVQPKVINNDYNLLIGSVLPQVSLIE